MQFTIGIFRYINGSSPKSFSEGSSNLFKDWARKKWKYDASFIRECEEGTIENTYESDRESAQKNATSYLSANWMHTQSLTQLLAFNLIDVELLYIERKILFLKTRSVLYWVSIGIGGFAIFLLDLFNKPFLLPLALSLILASIPYVKEFLFERKVTPVLQKLRVIHEEISTGSYNIQETVRRLQSCEEQGVNIHSITYSLFRLEH